jgi:hypothetical protein
LKDEILLKKILIKKLAKEKKRMGIKLDRKNPWMMKFEKNN